MLVSAILCTHNRRHLIHRAINSYRSQDWPEKELIVVEDGPAHVGDLLQGVENVTYLVLPQNAPNLSTKRNIACRAARGEVIVHMDDDDWSAPTRVRDQVERLLSGPEARISGYHTALFWDEITHQASRYLGSHKYTWGPCFCYYRQWVLEHPWPEHVHSCEDNSFLHAASHKQIVTAPGGQQIVVCLHEGNGRRPTGGASWPFVPESELPDGFLQAIAVAA